MRPAQHKQSMVWVGVGRGNLWHAAKRLRGGSSLCGSSESRNLCWGKGSAWQRCVSF